MVTELSDLSPMKWRLGFRISLVFAILLMVFTMGFSFFKEWITNRERRTEDRDRVRKEYFQMEKFESLLAKTIQVDHHMKDFNGEIKRIKHDEIDSKTFYREHVLKSVPVYLEGLSKEWPAYTKW